MAIIFNSTGQNKFAYPVRVVNPEYIDTTAPEGEGATAEDIAEGKVAFVNGEEVVGAFQPAEPIETEALTVTENGTYTASSGHAYTPVTVNVAGGGGISADDIAERTISGSIFGNASFIGPYAFRNCTSLTTANFPAVTSIGSYAFYDCSSLTTANFPAVTSIGGFAFQSCSSLTTVSFPVATSIGGYAFQACFSLTTANFPAVASIGSSAFQACFSLTTANFPAVRTINNQAFVSCSNLATASFPAVTSIGNSAFRNCVMLAELHLDSVPSVPTLGAGAFQSTPIGGYSASTGQYGSVFVPASLYGSFLTAVNWSSIASRIVSV